MSDDALEPTADAAAEEAERGRRLIIRAILAIAAVYAVVVAGTAWFSGVDATAPAIFRGFLFASVGMLVLRRRWNWARWLMVALLLLSTLDWLGFGDTMGVLAATTHAACAVVLLSRPVRAYVTGPD